MPVLAFRLPAPGHSAHYIAIDELGEWIAHEAAPNDAAAAVLERFAALLPADAKRRCEPELADEGRASGWFPTSRGLQRWKRLAAFALDVDPRCSNRIPLSLLGELLDRAALWQRLDPSRYPAGRRVELTSGLSESDTDEGYVEVQAHFDFQGRRGGAEPNGLDLHYTPKGGTARSISMRFTPAESTDPIVCAGFRPAVHTSSGGVPPTMAEILILLAHLDVLLHARIRKGGFGSTIGYGDVVVTAQTWESLPW